MFSLQRIAVAGLVALLLSGCETLPPRQHQELRAARVELPLYKKIVRERPLSPADIVTLSRRGVPNSSIIFFIHRSKSYYHLSRGDAVRLKRAGVSADVVTFMRENRHQNLLELAFPELSEW